MADHPRCRVCTHDSRAAIEQAILNQKPHAQIALTFGITYRQGGPDGKLKGNNKAIARHVAHMGETFQKAVQERDLASADAMVARLRALEEHVDTVLEHALKGDPIMVEGVAILHHVTGEPLVRYDDRLILRAVSEGRKNVALLAQLAGKVETGPEGLELLRAHLDTPEGRRLLAQLDELAAIQAEQGA